MEAISWVVGDFFTTESLIYVLPRLLRIYLQIKGARKIRMEQD